MHYFSPSEIQNENTAENILKKWILRFIQSAQILLPSTAEGSGVWENKDQVISNQNAPIYLWTISPYDIPVQWYHQASLSLFGQNGWMLAEFFFCVFTDWNEVLI